MLLLHTSDDIMASVERTALQSIQTRQSSQHPNYGLIRIFNSRHYSKKKSRSDSSAGEERGGEYIVFDSNVRKKLNHHFVPVSHWFVGKTLIYFEANLDLAPGQTCVSLYAFVEVMKIHKASPYAKYIQMVQPFRDHETKKFAVLDVADIRTITGLIQKNRY
ncbi:hypothetical protein [Parasitella parasitica]|uniref:Uncharacterized protein n=1 Tax=Parasitella parasitica TaxID=35722 RepID=A0A0B7NWZ4_9FUNG|nr:hypothetical protein [Parasitella parasitica]